MKNIVQVFIQKVTDIPDSLFVLVSLSSLF